MLDSPRKESTSLSGCFYLIITNTAYRCAKVDSLIPVLKRAFTVLKGAAGGAISGGIRTAMHNAIFGAGYQPQDENGNPVSYGADGVYRKGGLASLAMRSINKGGGFSHGRYVFTEEKGAKTLESKGLRKHENMHLQQMKRDGGYIRFYRTITGQYMHYGFDRGPLEDEANKYGGLKGKSPKRKK